MDRETYKMIAELMQKVPPKKETPDGQKFHIGEIVKIDKPNSWFSKMSVDEDKERLYQIQYSYYQKYGGEKEVQTKSYSLKHLFEDNSSSWYDESELVLVKSIEEIQVSSSIYREYTVVGGDSLWCIAAIQLGNGARYQEIKDINGLTSDTIFPGNILKLPK